MGKLVDLTGQRFGHLTVAVVAGKTKAHKTLWLCECDCGNKAVVVAGDLRSGRTRSCGCLRYGLPRKCGLKNRRLYSIWTDMIRRCEESNRQAYPNYGGRGIKVCKDWHDFICFCSWAISNGYQDALTLDRINVNGDYCPENCRWTTVKVQCNNKRNNSRIEYQGEIHTISEWSAICKIPRATILRRLALGWSAKRALTEAVHIENSHRKKNK